MHEVGIHFRNLVSVPKSADTHTVCPTFEYATYSHLERIQLAHVLWFRIRFAVVDKPLFMSFAKNVEIESRKVMAKDAQGVDGFFPPELTGKYATQEERLISCASELNDDDISYIFLRSDLDQPRRKMSKTNIAQIS